MSGSNPKKTTLHVGLSTTRQYQGAHTSVVAKSQERRRLRKSLSPTSKYDPTWRIVSLEEALVLFHYRRIVAFLGPLQIQPTLQTALPRWAPTGDRIDTNLPSMYPELPWSLAANFAPNNLQNIWLADSTSLRFIHVFTFAAWVDWYRKRNNGWRWLQRAVQSDRRIAMHWPWIYKLWSN